MRKPRTILLVIRFARLAVLLVTLSSAALTMLPVTAYAQSAQSEQQAAQVALQRSGGQGKVLGVTTESDASGKRVFAVKILSDGRVTVVRIPEG